MSAPGAQRRVFFALWPQAALARQMAALAVPAGARPTQVDDLHLTVLFLGLVTEATLAQLLEAAGHIRNPVILQQLVRLERWPGPKVLCLVGQPASALEQLRQALERVALGAGLALQPQEFRPHVTLSRAVGSGVPQAPSELAPLELHADRFCLAESASRGSGPRYRQLASWPLGSQSMAAFEHGQTR